MATRVTRDETAAGDDLPENKESVWEARYFNRLDADLGGLRNDVQRLGGKIDRLEEKLSGDVQRLDGKVDRLEEKLSGDVQRLDGKVDRLEEKLSGDVKRLDGKVDRLEEKLATKLDSQFRWTIGFFLAVMVAGVAKIVGH